MFALLLISGAVLELSYCANILILHPLELQSQLSYLKPLSRALADRNHSVTVLCGDNKNGFDEDKMEVLITRNLSYSSFQRDESHNFLQELIHVHRFTTESMRTFLSSSTVQDLFASNRTYDAVVVNTLMFDVLAIIPHRFKALTIEFRTIGDHLFSSLYNGNLIRTDNGCRPNQSMIRSFVERAVNAWTWTAMLLVRELIIVPEQQKLADDLCQYDGYESRPPLKQLLRNKSAMLANSHSTLSSRKYVPVFQKDVAGISLPWGKPQSSLPTVYEHFIAKSTTGFILVSWGSIYSSSDGDLGDTILQGLGRLPYQVIWKTSRSDFTNRVPENVMLSPWVPQIALLEDQRIKLFWTHGGVASTIEAVYYNSPVVVTPIIFDQPKNADFMVECGMGLRLSQDNITVDSLLSTINSVIDNPRYKESARQVSRAFKSRPVPPLEEAIFWIEHAISFKSRIPVEDNHAVELFLLLNSDVFIITFVCLVSLFMCPCLLFRIIPYSRNGHSNVSLGKLKSN